MPRHTISAIALALLLIASIRFAATRSLADGPATAPSDGKSYPLWDGKESIAQYARRAGIKQVEQNLDLGNKVMLKVTLIPAGKFMMGIPADETAVVKTLMHNGAGNPADELPQHSVTISKPFYFGIYTVTQEQYTQLIGTNPDKTKGPQLPAGASWDNGQEFCKKLSGKLSLIVRLPTEAEWEFACRAGTTAPFYTGSTITDMQSNYEATLVYPPGKPGIYRGKVIPVGSFKPNPWGLYDMHGNAGEWVADWYDKDYYAKSPDTDPPGPENGKLKVIRGGTFAYPPRGIRSASRDWGKTDMLTDAIGFRVAVEVK